MASLLLTMQGWQSGVGAAASYNNDTGLWTNLASDPQVASASNATSFACKGGWDGNNWYTISPTGGLHSYNPVTNTWKAGLAGSGSIITGTPTSARWAMASDGAYIYILSSSNDFRRYDPSLDALTALPIPPGTGYEGSIFLTYDGSGSIYGSKGGDSTISRYNIASNSWTQLPSGAWVIGNNGGFSVATWTATLSGSFWLVTWEADQTTLRAFQYNPVSNTWTTKATASVGGLSPLMPGGEDTDSSIRIWGAFAASQIYNIVSNTWAAGSSSPYTWSQGTNYAITRLFSAAFTWYQSDGVTQLPITVNLGSGVLSQTLTFHARVNTPVGRAAGVTVSVPANINSDAATVVGIASTAGGPFTPSFVTPALNPGDEFDVYISLTISSQQTLGLSKRFFLEVSAN